MTINDTHFHFSMKNFFYLPGLLKKKKKESHHRVKLSKLGKKKSEANPFLSPF